MIKLQSGKNFHNQIPTRKRRCLSIFFIRKTNIKWLSYISVDGSDQWLWSFFPIVVFSIFWKIEKQWRTLALIRCYKIFCSNIGYAHVITLIFTEILLILLKVFCSYNFRWPKLTFWNHKSNFQLLTLNHGMVTREGKYPGFFRELKVWSWVLTCRSARVSRAVQKKISARVCNWLMFFLRNFV